MAISQRLRNTLECVFYEHNLDRTIVYSNCTSGQNFSKWIHADLSTDTMEIPIILKDSVRDAHRINCISAEEVGDIYARLTTDNSFRSPSYKTADALINNICYNNNINRLSRAKDSNNNVYYGGVGMLFEEDFTPLFFITVSIHKEGEYILFDNVNIYVHPKVILEKKNIHTSIINKIIPYYLSNTIEGLKLFGYNSYYRNIRQKPIVPRVIIEDVKNRFVLSPHAPTPEESSNELINKFLYDNATQFIEETCE